MILPFFPQLHAERLLFDAIGHFSEEFEFLTGRDINQLLFGSRNAIASVGLPSPMAHFSKQLFRTNKTSAETMIFHHTHFPYFDHFVVSEKSRLVLDLILNGPGSSIHAHLGLLATSVKQKTHFAFCQKCANDQIATYGWPFWTRACQLPGIVICPIHKFPLTSTNLSINNRKTRYNYQSLKEHLKENNYRQERTDLPIKAVNQLFKLGKSTLFLLQNMHEQDGRVDLMFLYREAFQNSNLANLNGSLKLKEIVNRFNARWPQEILSLIDCPSRPSEWIPRLLYAPTTAHPLLHILLILSIEIDIEDFFTPTAILQPFGEGPWPCLNPLCLKHTTNSVTEVFLNKSWNSQKILGTFNCKKCGFTYLQAAHQNQQIKVQNKLRVVEYGDQWRKYLRANWLNAELSLRELSRRMGCDPRTIQNQARKMNLPSPRPNSKTKQSTQNTMTNQNTNVKHNKASRREIWQTLLSEQPDLSVTELRKLNPSTYAWLYRHDRKWLKVHSPHSTEKSKQKREPDLWFWFDLGLAISACKQVLKLNSESKSPKITKTHLAHLLNAQSAVFKNTQKFSISHQVFDSLAESKFDFATRRIWSNIISVENTEAQKWKLSRRFGLGRIKSHPQIQHELDLAIQFISFEELQTSRRAWILCSFLSDCLKAYSKHKLEEY